MEIKRMTSAQFKVALKRNNLRMKDVCELAGLTPLTGSKFINNRVQTTFSTIDRLMLAYHELRRFK